MSEFPEEVAYISLFPSLVWSRGEMVLARGGILLLMVNSCLSNFFVFMSRKGVYTAALSSFFYQRGFACCIEGIK